jgi:hypothetical protein
LAGDALTVPLAVVTLSMTLSFTERLQGVRSDLRSGVSLGLQHRPKRLHERLDRRKASTITVRSHNPHHTTPRDA